MNRYPDPRVPVPAHRGCHGGKKLLRLLSRFLAEQIRPEIIGLGRNLVPHIVATHCKGVQLFDFPFYSEIQSSVTGLQQNNALAS